MDMKLTRHPEIFRQALKLTLGVWFFTFILFMMPVVVATGRLPHFVVSIALVCNSLPVDKVESEQRCDRRIESLAGQLGG